MATFELTTTVPANLIDGDILTCVYSGTYTQLTLPVGKYIFECYGAQGGGSTATATNGGQGGYSKGTIEIQEETVAYLYVGGAGTSDGGNGGFNGGGAAYSEDGYGGGGGGSTDIRFGSTSIESRVIVAGGGGGASYLNGSSAAGGSGGGRSGGYGRVSSVGDIEYAAAQGGSQTAGGQGAFIGVDSTNGGNGSLYNGGQGGRAGGSSSGAGGGGGGYYGGGGGTATYFASARYGVGGGAGGSGYISSSFTDTTSSTGTRSGDGFIQITIVEVKKNPTTSIYCKINESWIKGSKLFHRMNGEWKEVLSLSLKRDGEWVGGASSSSSMGDSYPVFNLGNTSLLRGTIEDCSFGEDGLRGYVISEPYGIEVYSGKALGNSGSGGITLMPLAWTSTGVCNITINDISKSGRLFIGAYGANSGNVVNDTNIQLVVKNDSNIVASYDLTYVTASRMHTIEISNPGTISIELSACGENVVKSIHGFITHISYQAID